MGKFHSKSIKLNIFNLQISIPVNKLLFGLIIVMFAFGLYLVLVVTRVDAEQQMAQKIFYFHVPSAWSMFLAYFLVLIAGIQYLRTRAEKWDRFGLASAEVGTLFCALVLITGPIWATPIWGTPWSWEPRLTTTLILFLIYIGYFMLRQYGGDRKQIARLSAIIGIIAFIDVPFIYFSINLWAERDQVHPQSDMGGQPTDVLGTFLFMLLTFTILLSYMIRYRMHVLELDTKLTELEHGI